MTFPNVFCNDHSKCDLFSSFKMSSVLKLQNMLCYGLSKYALLWPFISCSIFTFQDVLCYDLSKCDLFSSFKMSSVLKFQNMLSRKLLNTDPTTTLVVSFPYINCCQFPLFYSNNCHFSHLQVIRFPSSKSSPFLLFKNCQLPPFKICSVMVFYIVLYFHLSNALCFHLSRCALFPRNVICSRLSKL